MGTWYEAELEDTIHDTNELAHELRRLAHAQGADAAAEALGSILPDVATHLANLQGALHVLTREHANDAPTAQDAATRLAAHHAFLASALTDRSEEAQGRRAEEEKKHETQLRIAAKAARDRIDVALGVTRRGPSRDAEVREVARSAAEAALEALPVLWVGRTIVVHRDQAHAPDAVLTDIALVLDYLGHWLAPP